MFWYPIYKKKKKSANSSHIVCEVWVASFYRFWGQATTGPQMTFIGFTLGPFFFPFSPPGYLLSPRLLSLAFPYSLARLLGIEPRAGQVLYRWAPNPDVLQFTKKLVIIASGFCISVRWVDYFPLGTISFFLFSLLRQGLRCIEDWLKPPLTIAKVDLELLIFPPPTPQCWDERFAPPGPVLRCTRDLS